MNFKVLGLFGIILLTAVITYNFTAVPKITNSVLEVSQISAEMSGLNRETRGIVTDITEAKGHVFFTLKDASNDKKIRGVLFAKTNAADPNHKQILLRSRETNSVVRLRGEIDIYKGELEIKTWQVYQND